MRCRVSLRIDKQKMKDGTVRERKDKRESKRSARRESAKKKRGSRGKWRRGRRRLKIRRKWKSNFSRTKSIS